MTPQEQERLRTLENIVFALVKSDRYVFERDLQFQDGRNIQVSSGTGTKLALSSTEKMGFWGKTPIVRPSAITSPSGAGSAGVDQPARNSIDEIINTLQALGLTA